MAPKNTSFVISPEGTAQKRERKSYNPTKEQRAFDKLDSIMTYLVYHMSRKDEHAREDALDIIRNLKDQLEDQLNWVDKINLSKAWKRSDKWRA